MGDSSLSLRVIRGGREAAGEEKILCRIPAREEKRAKRAARETGGRSGLSGC
jgi:hypothetical protein